MTIKTILACLTDARSADSVLAAAALIARRHDAHVIGLHTVESLSVYPGVALHVPDIVFTEYGRSQVAQSTEIKEIFEEKFHAEEFAHERPFDVGRRGDDAAGLPSLDPAIERGGSAGIVVRMVHVAPHQRGQC